MTVTIFTPLGDAPKEQVTLRISRQVVAHFKGGGPGGQTRISEVLERQAGSSPAVAEGQSGYLPGEGRKKRKG